METPVSVYRVIANIILCPKTNEDPPISGVPDLVVEGLLDGRVLLVAEVKKDVEVQGENYQLISALRALQKQQKKHPIVGVYNWGLRYY